MKKYFFLFVIFILFITSVFAENLPTVGGSEDTWGTILNSYLEKLSGLNATELNQTMVNGTNIYESSINTTHILDGTIIGDDIANITNITINGSIGIGTFSPGAELEVVGNIISTGTFWTGRSTPSNYAWNGVAYGNGMFVAISNNGGTNRVMTSEDGINWSVGETPSDENWQDVIYGNGMFVAVGNSGNVEGVVMTSPDGVIWTNRSASASSTWTKLAYGNNTFVAVAPGNSKVMTSEDGVIWTNRTASAENQWNGVTYGNGKFVAVAASGDNRIMTSEDGITWTNRTAAEDNQWRDVAYGNGMFVAVADSGTYRIMTSEDGITWTNRTAAEDNTWTSVIYGEGLFVGVSLSGTVMTSPDGATWTSRTAPESNNWQDVAYGNGMFVAVASSGGNRVMTSGKPKERIVSHNNVYQGGMNILGGNVGIGTQYPTAELNVVGDEDLTGNLSLGEKITFNLGEIIDNIVDGWITITGSLNVTENLDITGNITGDWATLNNLNVTGTSYLGDITITADNITTNNIISKDGNISFYNNVGSEKVKITDDGKVGIGTSSPNIELEVYKTSAGESMRITNTQTYGWMQFYEGETVRGYLGFGDAGHLFTGATSDSLSLRAQGALHLGGSGDKLAMTINNSKVGIGITSPEATLDVSGSARVGNGGTILKNIQVGTIGDCTSDNAGSSGSVTYPTAFTSTPNVLVTPVVLDGAGCTSVRINVQSNTGFSWQAWAAGDLYDIPSDCDCIYWMAIET